MIIFMWIAWLERESLHHFIRSPYIQTHQIIAFSYPFPCTISRTFYRFRFIGKYSIMLFDEYTG